MVGLMPIALPVGDLQVVTSIGNLCNGGIELNTTLVNLLAKALDQAMRTSFDAVAGRLPGRHIYVLDGSQLMTIVYNLALAVLLKEIDAQLADGLLI